MSKELLDALDRVIDLALRESIPLSELREVVTEMYILQEDCDGD